MDKELKIFALEYVKLHDRLIKEEKLAIAEFIMNASDEQVIYLLATGEVKNSVTKEEVENLLEYFGESGYSFKEKVELFLSRGLIPDSAKPWAVLGIAAIAAAAGILAYRKKFSAAAKACASRQGTDKKACINKFKMDAQKAKIAVMQKGLAACGKTKDPAKCKAKLSAKIAKEKAKLGAT